MGNVAVNGAARFEQAHRIFGPEVSGREAFLGWALQAELPDAQWWALLLLGADHLADPSPAVAPEADASGAIPGISEESEAGGRREPGEAGRFARRALASLITDLAREPSE